MKITSAKVIKWCISCKNCENICPEIFKVDPTSHVISDKFNQNALKLLMAEKMCPVQVIKVEKEGNYSLESPIATLKSKTYLTPDTLELAFETKDFSFIPGQYVSLQMNDWRGDFSRSYSIAGGDKNSFVLTVKLLKKGRGSNFLRKLWERSWKNWFRKKNQVEYIGGLGDFTLQNTPEKKVMIATGTGLAPMISMLRALPEETQKLVIFGGRYEQDLYYLDLIESFRNVELITCVSRPGQDYTGNTGRVTDYLHKIHPEDEVYICGNPNMVHDTIKHLQTNGHFRERIFHEDFTLAWKPSGVLKSIFFEGNLPGVLMLQQILIYSGVLTVPFLYFLATKYGFMNADVLWKSLYTRLFDLSWYAVVFVMLVRPLADLFPKLGILRRLVVLRKWFWILSASVILSALLAKWIQNPVTFSAFFTLQAWSLWYPLLARLSEVTAIILFVTSNNFSQKKLGIWWKRIQKTSYIYFVTGGIIAARWAPDKFIYETIAIVWVLWILAKLRLKIWK